jgi:hypothetical protein
MTDNVRKVIAGAIAVLDECGWCQGTSQNFMGQHCAVGALAEAAQRTLADRAKWYNAPVFIDHLYAIDVVTKKTGTVMLSRWNDAKGRTQAEVRAVFEAALAA